jgi:phosphoadenosine phosphosulfate reductase
MASLTLPKPIQLPLSKNNIYAINAHLTHLAPEQILAWALDYLPNLYQTTALGLTGIVAIDMLSKITTSPPPLIFLDTLYHFPETYELLDEVKEKYNVPVHIYKPDGCEDVKSFEDRHGDRLWESNEDKYDYIVKV